MTLLRRFLFSRRKPIDRVQTHVVQVRDGTVWLALEGYVGDQLVTVTDASVLVSGDVLEIQLETQVTVLGQ